MQNSSIVVLVINFHLPLHYLPFRSKYKSIVAFPKKSVYYFIMLLSRVLKNTRLSFQKYTCNLSELVFCTKSIVASNFAWARSKTFIATILLVFVRLRSCFSGLAPHGAKCFGCRSAFVDLISFFVPLTRSWRPSYINSNCDNTFTNLSQWFSNGFMGRILSKELPHL